MNSNSCDNNKTEESNCEKKNKKQKSSETNDLTPKETRDLFEESYLTVCVLYKKQ